MTNHHEETAAETRRFTADEILQAALENARGELKRSVSKLAFSGIAGGITMGLSSLGVACVLAFLGEGGWKELVATLLYPAGFIAVIIGRAQLFTENTLYPVVLVLDEDHHLIRLIRLWTVVLLSNVIGAMIFGALAAKSAALRPEILSALLKLAETASSSSAAHLFWSGVIGGWLIALVAWTVTASHWTIGQLAVIYLFTFLVGVGRFGHCIAGSCEILTAVWAGSVTTYSYLHWILPTTLGNICGGVVLVSLLNYGQVRAT